MKFYCGIDLSARDCQVCVIDEQLKIMVQQKLRNELPKICQLLEPYFSLTEVASQSETFSKRVAKQRVNQMIERLAHAATTA
ncbi:MAG: hypothetical protein DMF73_20470 [Acidobacteria bacterium]|nr:MAG: hypothetical protein DMF73_20470 [Acidobacteriota bacterium]